MELSELRQRYRTSRDRQQRLTRVLLVRTVSQEMCEAISIIPVMQGLTSPQEPDASLTFDPDPSTYDPWRLHLDLHRRLCARLNLHVSRRLPSSSGTLDSEKEAAPTSESDSSAGALPLSCLTAEEDSTPPTTSSLQVSGSTEDHRDTSSWDAPPTAGLQRNENPPTGGPIGDNSSSVGPPSGGCQLSVGAVAPSHQKYQPFPHRKNPRISEAARRLGMYASC